MSTPAEQSEVSLILTTMAAAFVLLLLVWPSAGAVLVIVGAALTAWKD